MDLQITKEELDQLIADCVKKFMKNILDRKDLAEVTNKNGHEDGNWIRAWGECAGVDIDNPKIGCSNPLCDNYGKPLDDDNRVGGHVHIVGDAPNLFYIAPLCKKCNSENDFFFVDRKKMLLLSKVKQYLNKQN